MANSYNVSQFQAIALDVYNGSTAQVRNFQQLTNISYPICTNASNTGNAYGVFNDYSVVVDQAGIIRYLSYGFNETQIRQKINELLATSNILDAGEVVPVDFRLFQNHPNPFNPVTRISFELPESAEIILTVFDLTGKAIRKLAEGKYPAGQFTFEFSGHSLASGIYFYELRAGEFRSVRKMVLQR